MTPIARIPVQLNDDGVPVELAAGGVPGGGPCTVVIGLTFESEAATQLEALWSALVDVYGPEHVGVENGRALPGGPAVSFHWRVTP